jgi:hypothetical protein
VRAKSNFAFRFKLIWAVQSFAQKYFAFVFSVVDVCFARSAADKGAYRDRHEAWCGIAVDADVLTDERHGRGRRSCVVLARPCRR